MILHLNNCLGQLKDDTECYIHATNKMVTKLTDTIALHIGHCAAGGCVVLSSGTFLRI